MTHTKRLGRYAAATATATLVIVSSALPAAAGPIGPGDPTANPGPSFCIASTRAPDSTYAAKEMHDMCTEADRYPSNRPLRRIGRQLVRGDNLTGAGVAAPTWVPQQW